MNTLDQKTNNDINSRHKQRKYDRYRAITKGFTSVPFYVQDICIFVNTEEGGLTWEKMGYVYIATEQYIVVA